MGSPHHCVLKKHHPEVSTKPPPPCVTRMLPLWSLTTAPACARPVSPEMTPPEPCSPPLLEGQDIRASWLAWDRRTLMSETRPNPREVSSPSSTPLSTAS